MVRTRKTPDHRTVVRPEDSHMRTAARQPSKGGPLSALKFQSVIHCPCNRNLMLSYCNLHTIGTMLIVASYLSTSKLSLVFIVACTSADCLVSVGRAFLSIFVTHSLAIYCKCEKNARLWAQIFSITVWNYAAPFPSMVAYCGAFTAFETTLGSVSVCTEHVGMSLWLPGRHSAGFRQLFTLIHTFGLGCPRLALGWAVEAG